MASQIECPSCGAMVLTANSKGEGALDVKKITRMGEARERVLLSLRVLRASVKERAVRSVEVEGVINRGRALRGLPLLRSNAVSGRLSELLGMRMVEMCYGDVRVEDKETMEWRFVRKPLWWLGAEGLLYLDTGFLPGQEWVDRVGSRVGERWSFPSQSKPGVLYEVVKGMDGVLKCSCLGFRGAQSCRHVLKAVEWSRNGDHAVV